MYASLSAILADKGNAVYSVSPTDTVQDAVNVMVARNVGAVLVLEGGNRPVGIFTERDVLVRVVGEGKHASSVLVSEVMTPDFFVVKPSLSVREAMSIVTETRCRHLPVVENGLVVGVISIGDLTKWVARDSEIEIRHLVNYITGQYPL